MRLIYKRYPSYPVTKRQPPFAHEQFTDLTTVLDQETELPKRKCFSLANINVPVSVIKLSDGWGCFLVVRLLVFLRLGPSYE